MLTRKALRSRQNCEGLLIFARLKFSHLLGSLRGEGVFKMSEKTQAQTQAKPAAKEAKKETKNEVVKAQESQSKRIKKVWTLEKCAKYARRFTSEAIWASGAPSSYKSAVAHGWKDQCLAEMEKAKSKVVSGNFSKTSKSTTDSKRAA
jgi:hypothetical protein